MTLAMNASIPKGTLVPSRLRAGIATCTAQLPWAKKRTYLVHAAIIACNMHFTYQSSICANSPKSSNFSLAMSSKTIVKMWVTLRRSADLFERCRVTVLCNAPTRNDASADGNSAVTFPLLFEARLNDKKPAAQADRRSADLFERCRVTVLCNAPTRNDASADGNSAVTFPLLFEARLNDKKPAAQADRRSADLFGRCRVHLMPILLRKTTPRLRANPPP